MYEHRKQPLLSRAAFLSRVWRHALVAFAIAGGSLIVGILGYHGFEGLPWIDALLNSAMLLGGMGEVDPLHTLGGKMFASFYALYSGLIFLVSTGVLFAPIIHRFLHRFHLETQSNAES